MEARIYIGQGAVLMSLDPDGVINHLHLDHNDRQIIASPPIPTPICSCLIQKNILDSRHRVYRLVSHQYPYDHLSMPTNFRLLRCETAIYQLVYQRAGFLYWDHSF